jgi:MoaA/NifB/PqqE/SkfB family radical SAM enzyme
LSVELTHRCNATCSHCFVGQRREGIKEMTTGEVLSLVRGFQVLGGRSLAITGGEAFVRADLGAVVVQAARWGLSVSLTTNGTHPRALSADWLDPSVVQRVRLSLDGPEETHDAIRGRGSHARVVRFLDRLERLGIPFEIQCTIHQQNLDALPWVWRFASGLRGLCLVKFTPALPIGRGETGIRLLDPPALARLRQRLVSLERERPAAFRWGSEVLDQGALAEGYRRFRAAPLAFLLFVVHPSGELFPWFGLQPGWSLGLWHRALGRLDRLRKVLAAIALVEVAFQKAEWDIARHGVTDLSWRIASTLRSVCWRQ